MYNKWLRKSLKIKKETLTNKKEAFETSVITDGACYRLLGIVEEEAFQKMVEELSF